MDYATGQAAWWLKRISSSLQEGYQYFIANQPAKLGPLAECPAERGVKRRAAQQHRPARRRLKRGVGDGFEGDDSDGFDGAGGGDSDGGNGEEQVRSCCSVCMCAVNCR